MDRGTDTISGFSVSSKLTISSYSSAINVVGIGAGVVFGISSVVIFDCVEEAVVGSLSIHIMIQLIENFVGMFVVVDDTLGVVLVVCLVEVEALVVTLVVD